ncbi:MAG: hypothetical protein P8O16_01240 [Algoriphagus sp.]|nr:hypothetical protein [Algoriphagus sp.]MDG1275872.1 hypothetical protein [Algoriphagus sp.]
MINWKKPIRFKIGDVPWEFPLNVLLLLIVITLILMLGGAYLGFQFGSGG